MKKDTIYQICWKTKAQLEAIATYLFGIGFRNGDDSVADFCKRFYESRYHWVIFEDSTKAKTKRLGGNFEAKTHHKTITLDELFAMEQPDFIPVVHSEYYTAVITKDEVKLNDFFTFSHDFILQIAETINKVKQMEQKEKS